MKINDDHLYHGAVLTQIAEHDQFTAINALKVNGDRSRSAFRVNDDIGVYLKYATKPTESFNEYPFTFNRQHLEELAAVADMVQRVFLALVCVKARQICLVKYGQLETLVKRRSKDKGADEDQYTLLATLPEGGKFRVYVNAPGRRKTMLGKPILVARNAFPDRLFS